jgi:hypothetical protein
MPDLPPDPLAEIDARINHFKKQTQKLSLEFLEAQAELERAQRAVRQGSSGVSPGRPSATPRQGIVIVSPFAGGVGYSLHTANGPLWFDTRPHAIEYAREVFPECEIEVVLADGTVVHVSQLQE